MRKVISRFGYISSRTDYDMAKYFGGQARGRRAALDDEESHMTMKRKRSQYSLVAPYEVSVLCGRPCVEML